MEKTGGAPREDVGITIQANRKYEMSPNADVPSNTAMTTRGPIRKAWMRVRRLSRTATRLAGVASSGVRRLPKRCLSHEGIAEFMRMARSTDDGAIVLWGG